MILTTEEVTTATLKVISATTKVILTTEEVITTTFKVVSATIVVILATEEVITATVKVILVTHVSPHKTAPPNKSPWTFCAVANIHPILSVETLILIIYY